MASLSSGGYAGEDQALTGDAAPDAVDRRRLAAWVLREIMPHEPGIRGWLRQHGQSPDDIDDLIQEAMPSWPA